MHPRYLQPLRIGAALMLATPSLAAQGGGTGNGGPPADRIPVHATLTIDSRILAERRTINIYTPPGYDRSPDTAYPMVYMLDGGLAEDFPHIVNTLDSLIGLGVIRPVIVVGIENTERRRDLTGPTAVAADSAIAPHVGGSAAFRRFIGEELIPELRARFRCTGETTIVGESLAGLFIVETLLLEPALFRRYIALSPSLWWNNGALVQSSAARLAAIAGDTGTLYLASANEAGIVAGTQTLAATLATRAPAGLTWYYEPRPDLEHNTIFRAVAPGAFAKLLR
jgi:hypothetical protein